MTTRPSRPELRFAVLAHLSAHTAEVEWAATGAHVAFADSIVDWADWLAGCTSPPPPLQGSGSDGAHRKTVLAEAAREVARIKRDRQNMRSEGETG